MKEREQMEKFRAQNKSMPCMGIILTTIFVQQQKNRNQVGAHQWKMVEYTMVCPYSGTLCCHCQKYFRSILSAMEGFPLSVRVCVCVPSHFHCIRLFATLWTTPGSSVHQTFQARLCLSPGDLPYPGIEPTSLTSSALVGEFFTTRATWEAL